MRKTLDIFLEKSFGLIFLILGAAGFHTAAPFINLDRFIPELHPFMQILSDSGYFFVVKTVEAIAGFMILTKIRVPLALTLITPVIVNIVLYHLFLDQRLWYLTPFIVFTDIYLIRKYWSSFSPLLKN